MTTRTLTARTERQPWEPTQLLGVGLSVYVICLALYSGLRPDGALSIYSTTGASQFIAVVYILIGVLIGLMCMASAMLRNNLAPALYVAAYLLAYATLALFRIETSWTANVFNCARFLATASVAAGAWLHSVREAGRAYQ